MAGADEFIERTHFLEMEVGDGDITSGVFVDQPYAQRQHQNLEYNHRVGMAMYLTTPLMANVYGLIEKIARNAVTDFGSDLSDTMRSIADDMAGYVKQFAPLGPPIDPYILKKSASPYVIDNGVEIYRQAAESARDPNDDPNWDYK